PFELNGPRLRGSVSSEWLGGWLNSEKN
ncbi:MAG: hypothetical protein RJA36_1641, partial [Pseudomonadota bacterium]